ncbi:MAG: arginine--tRNA ligase [Bdellovibrionales bacterium]|nr:arginine--tRNA ligase [Bdellovibrionales bacterium]
MNEYKKQAAHLIQQALDQLEITLSENEILSLLEIPKNEKMGDIAFPCFSFAKLLRKSPVQIAQTINEQITSNEFFSRISADGPYLNFTFNKSKLASDMLPEILNNKFTAERENQNERVMIEYSQPNTHKAFHVGHTRNVSLGDSLVRLYRWAGYEVIAANYIGDVGTHIAKCLWYYKKFHMGEEPKTHKGEFLGKLYEKANEMLDFSLMTKAPVIDVFTAVVKDKLPHPHEEKWSVLTVKHDDKDYQVVCGGTGVEKNNIVAFAPVGSRFAGREVQPTDKKGVSSEGVVLSEKELGIGTDKNKIYTFNPDTQLSIQVANALRADDFKDIDVVKEIQSRQNEVHQVLIDLEKQEPETYALWEKTKKWSLDEFYEIYDWLDAKFDHYFFESEVGDAGKDTVKKAYEDGILVKSEGAIGADLSQFKLPFFLLLKSNGTGLYSTKDIALAKVKFDQFKIDRSIYVVDDGQSLHFQQVFKTLELLGYKNASKCHHLAYAKVERPDGKMSSRKGNVILLSELRTLLMNKITTEFLSKYDGDWSEALIKDTAHKISVATIKYGMLNQDSRKNIVFDLDEWTARTGNTGPYLMYAFARTNSILKEVADSRNTTPEELLKQLTQFDGSEIKEESEFNLLRSLTQFPLEAQKAAEKFEPQILCIYLYGLSKDFSSFYSNCSVLHAKTPEQQLARLALVVATGKVLKQGLNLLGITTVEKM